MAFGGLRGGNYLHRFDPEAVIREALEHIRNLDYYSRDDNSRLGCLRSLSPQNSLAGLGDRSMSEELTSDTVRRVNLVVQLTNSLVCVRATLYAQIHPMVQEDGRYPRNFDRPKRVEEFLSMDGHTIDCILGAYNLPRETLSLRRPGVGSRTYSDNSSLSRDYDVRERRLAILFEFLGADVGRVEELRDTRQGLGGLSSGFTGALRRGFE